MLRVIREIFIAAAVVGVVFAAIGTFALVMSVVSLVPAAPSLMRVVYLGYLTFAVGFLGTLLTTRMHLERVTDH